MEGDGMRIYRPWSEKWIKIKKAISGIRRKKNKKEKK
jgi:hypothetical protein